jgi:hypothetical protein
MKSTLSATYILQQFPCISQAMCNAYPDGQSVKINRGLPYAFHTAKFAKIQSFQFLIRVKFIGCSHGSLNNASCGTENYTGAG